MQSALEQPAEVYRRFSKSESEVLRQFVADVRRLAQMRFFKQVPHTASLSFDGEGLRVEMQEPDDEDLRAAITQFRQIYSHDEPNSFRKAMKVLKRSVHERGGTLRDAALTDLDGHIEAERKALSEGIGVGIVFERDSGSQSIDPRTIIDAYFHGRYLHSGNPKSDLARELDDLQPFARYTLYSVMLTLRNVYWNAANAVDRVLALPALLDGPELPS